MKELQQKGGRCSCPTLSQVYLVSGSMSAELRFLTGQLLYILELVLNDNKGTILFTYITGPDILMMSHQHQNPCGFTGGAH